jgi:uncharacterized membrane protein YfcA
MRIEFLLPLSLIAGFVGAMGGMGGGVVLIPVLTLSGVDIRHAIALSIVSVIATSSGSASAYVRDHITNLKLGMFLEIFTMTGAIVGASLTIRIAPRFLFFLLSAVLMSSAAVLWFKRGEEWSPVRCQDRFSNWLELEGRYPERSTGHWIEAGALKVLIHDLVMGLPPKVSTTTSNLIIGVTALAGTSVYLSQGLIEPGPVAVVVLGVLGGAFVGTRVLVRLPNRAVRRIFLVLLVVLSIEVIVRGIRAGE